MKAVEMLGNGTWQLTDPHETCDSQRSLWQLCVRAESCAAIAAAGEQPAFVVDDSMRLIEANQYGLTLLQERGGGVRCRDGIFGFRDSVVSRKVEQRVASLLASPLSQVTQLAWPTRQRPWLLRFAHVSRHLQQPVRRPSALILISMVDMCAKATLDRAVLGALYQLTETEVRLCSALAAVSSLVDAAIAAGISYEHARQRIKIVFKKTRTRNQSELCMLLERMALK